jgi:hypothetical protein
MHATMNECFSGNTYFEVGLHFNPTYSFITIILIKIDAFIIPVKLLMGITLPINVQHY